MRQYKFISTDTGPRKTCSNSSGHKIQQTFNCLC